MKDCMSTINRTKFIEEYCGQIDPLFDKADELTIAITKCQDILAEYILPDSTTSKDDVINGLLGILDDRRLVKLMRDLCGAK